MNHPTANVARGASIFACVVAAAFISGITAVMGSRLGGLQDGGWNWQFMPPLFIGWIGGLFVASICAITLAHPRVHHFQLSGTLFIAPVFTMIVSAGFYFIELTPERVSASDYHALEKKSKNDPTFISTLIDKSRRTSLTDNERQILWQALGQQNAIPENDIDYLLCYFEKDISGIAMLIKYQKVSPDQLRQVYATYKNDKSGGRWRICHDLLELSSTPPDIIRDIKAQQD